VIHARPRVTGRLFQARYGSVVPDEDNLRTAARHVALNPTRARLVRRAQNGRGSSVRAHFDRRDDGWVAVAPLLERRRGQFQDVIDPPATAEAMSAPRGAETTGRPLGSPAFLYRLAGLTVRVPRPTRRDPKPDRDRRFVKVSP
jgi:putative transposase